LVHILLEQLPNMPMHQQQMELVERKGLGHPDSMCDAIMESISVAISQAYVEATGQVLHHNIDKGLLVAGQTSPALGGGGVVAPMRLIIGDRATTAWDDHSVPVGDIAEATARRWMAEHLRFVDPKQHLLVQTELQQGSAELMDIFARDRLGANDTSAAVGYAPLSETERCVLAAEQRLNSAAFKAEFPEAGEDVKVMGCRQGRHLALTVALAMVDRFLPSEKAYFERKDAIRDNLQGYLESKLHELDSIEIHLNTLDRPGRGLGGMYLTVLGTSAESGDGGQVGRGNRVNGVISLKRPMSTEAAAGKNPVSHVGKIYNLLSHQIARHIYTEVEPVQEVYVWLCSQIGASIDAPWIVAAQVILTPGASLTEVERTIEDITKAELSDMRSFLDQLVRGAVPIC
jgi:S-adenosylmethionine synthetase